MSSEEIPEELNHEIIGPHIDVLPGYPFNSKEFSIEDGFPLIRIRDLILQAVQTYYKGKYNESFIIEKEDILIGMDGDFNIVIWKGPKALLNQRLVRIKSKDKIFHETYIFHHLSLKLKEINDITPQTTVKHLSIKDITAISLPCPDYEVQEKIAAILMSVDSTIEKTKGIIEKYQMMKQGMMHDLIVEKGNYKFDMISGPLSDIAQINPTTKISHLKDNTIVSFISMADVSDQGRIINRQIQPFKNVKSGFTRFQENDVLFAKITPCMENGKGGYATNLRNLIGFGSTEFHILRAKENKSPKFIYYCTMTNSLRLKAESKMSGSAGQQRVPTSFFEGHEINYPETYEKQEEIATILTSIDNKIESEQAYLTKLIKLKSGLMQDLLTGKVPVTVKEAG